MVFGQLVMPVQCCAEARWNLDFGLWTVGFGLWPLGFGLLGLGIGFWTLVFGLQVKVSE